jgi:hypothetical protein
MIGHKLPNKTKSATVAEAKLFPQLNTPKSDPVRARIACGRGREVSGVISNVLCNIKRGVCILIKN